MLQTGRDDELTLELVMKIMAAGELDTKKYRYKFARGGEVWGIYRNELAALADDAPRAFLGDKSCAAERSEKREEVK